MPGMSSLHQHPQDKPSSGSLPPSTHCLQEPGQGLRPRDTAASSFEGISISLGGMWGEERGAILSHPVPSHPTLSHPIRPHPNPSHPMPSHPTPSSLATLVHARLPHSQPVHCSSELEEQLCPHQILGLNTAPCLVMGCSCVPKMSHGDG